MGDVESLPTSVWDRSIAINLTSAFLMAKHCVPLLKRKPHSVIVNLSSISGMANQADAMVYSVTKAALISLTKSEAIDLARYGIRAVAICPGSVSTTLVDRAIELTAASTGREPSEQRRIWESQYPTGRFTTPEEVADLTLFLSSDRARNITGSAIVIDGGITAVLPER
jgi:NAD(P)-dependent dehydrogenase (short-subunit alcohol dehydrogenase family)